jgi:hypothetical protein
MKENIIDKITQLRYDCAILENRGFSSLTDNISKELDILYRDYPGEYREADKRIKDYLKQ